MVYIFFTLNTNVEAIAENAVPMNVSVIGYVKPRPQVRPLPIAQLVIVVVIVVVDDVDDSDIGNIIICLLTIIIILEEMLHARAYTPVSITSPVYIMM